MCTSASAHRSTITIESNLPEVVADFKKKHGYAEKLEDIAIMMRPYVDRLFVRFGLSQFCLSNKIASKKNFTVAHLIHHNQLETHQIAKL